MSPRLHLLIPFCVFNTILSMVFILIASTSVFSDTCNKELVHGWLETWEPFVLGTPANASGLDMEILAAVVSGAGCTLKHTDNEIPWMRRLKWIEEGKLDLLSGASLTEERAQYAYFIGPYRAEYLALFVKKGNTVKYKISNFSDIEDTGFKIGIELGATYGPMVDSVLKKIGNRAEPIHNSNANRKKVLVDRLDGYLSYLPDEPIALKKLGADIEMHPMHLINTGDIYIMLSKKVNSKEIRNALQDSLDKIKTDGTLNTIFKKYSEKYGVAKW